MEGTAAARAVGARAEAGVAAQAGATVREEVETAVGATERAVGATERGVEGVEGTAAAVEATATAVEATESAVAAAAASVAGGCLHRTHSMPVWRRRRRCPRVRMGSRSR